MAAAANESEQHQEHMRLLGDTDADSLPGYEATSVSAIQQSHSNSPTADHQESSAIEASTSLKLKCFIYVLFLIGLGFIATVVETQAFFSRLGEKKPQLERYPTEWVCYGIKIGFLIPAIGSLLFLQNRAIVPGKIPKVRLHLQANAVVLKDVDSYIHLSSSLGNPPSKLFLATSLLFSCFSCLSAIIEIACDAIAATQPEASNATEISELLRRFLLLVFIVLQTRFFLLNSRICIQWKLTGVWFAASHILASNVAAWFINVGFEMREVIDTTESEMTHNDFCTNKSIYSVARGLYPFLIEYYVMSALLAYALVSNTGSLANAIRRASDIAAVTPDYIRGLLNPESHDRCNDQNSQADYLIMRTFSCTISFGIGLVLVALAVSVFVRYQGKDKPEAQITFYSTLLLLYTCGIVCTTMILRALKSDEAGNQELSGVHRTDRILLWIGTAAITVNDIYTFWNCFTKERTQESLPAASNKLMAASSFLNICQSLMQVYVLECALVRKFRLDTGVVSDGLFGQALLLFLILLNAAEWLINTICFNFFFPRSQMDSALALSLLAMPLQVFFRFHSIACIHDFRKHCRDNSRRLSVSHSRADDCVEIDFPVMTQQQIYASNAQ